MPVQAAAKAAAAATPTSISMTSVTATDRTNIKTISTLVAGFPVAERYFTTDTVRTHVIAATIASGIPNPGEMVNMPSTTATSVTSIINDANEKPPDAADDSLYPFAATGCFTMPWGRFPSSGEKQIQQTFNSGDTGAPQRGQVDSVVG